MSIFNKDRVIALKIKNLHRNTNTDANKHKPHKNTGGQEVPSSKICEKIITHIHACIQHTYTDTKRYRHVQIIYETNM